MCTECSRVRETLEIRGNILLVLHSQLSHRVDPEFPRPSALLMMFVIYFNQPKY